MTARPGWTRVLAVAMGPGVALACGAPGPGAPRTIERLAERAAPVACAPLDVEESESVVADLAAVSDSTFLVLLPLERRVVVYGPDLRPRREIVFEAAGPRGVVNPRSAAIVGDTLVWITDIGPHRLRALSLSGEDRGTVRTPFPPDRIRWSPAGLVVTAFPLGVRAGGPLAWWLKDGEVRPLGVPAERHDDPRAEALANLLEPTPMPDGDVIVVHPLVSSRGARLRARAGGGFDVEPVTVPVAPSEAGRLGRVPPSLFEEEAIEEVAAVALGASADRATGQYLYLTRTGRTLPDGTSEKAIVRAGPDLSFVSAHRLDVDAQAFAYVTTTRTAIVIDAEARWHRCVLP